MMENLSALLRNSVVPLVVTIFLAGCATRVTIGSLQTDCEAKTTTFPAMVTCLKEAVAEQSSHDSRFRNSDIVKLYSLKAEQLSERVQKKELSDLDARVELQKLYVELKHQETMQRAAKAAAYGAVEPRTTNCYAIGNSVHCNSY